MIGHVATARNFDVRKLSFVGAVELTIAAGLVTVTQTVHTIDTEADAAGDEVDTINGGAAGDMLLLRAEDASRQVTLKHGAANIRTPTGGDHVLEVDGIVWLQFDGTNWNLQQ